MSSVMVKWFFVTSLTVTIDLSHRQNTCSITEGLALFFLPYVRILCCNLHSLCGLIEDKAHFKHV